MDDQINSKQILNQIESVIKDVSNIKEKHFNSNEEYEKIKIVLDQLQQKTKEVKSKLVHFNADSTLADSEIQGVSIENAIKKIEENKADFDQLRKGKLSPEVIFFIILYILKLVLKLTYYY